MRIAAPRPGIGFGLGFGRTGCEGAAATSSSSKGCSSVGSAVDRVGSQERRAATTLFDDTVCLRSAVSLIARAAIVDAASTESSLGIVSDIGSMCASTLFRSTETKK